MTSENRIFEPLSQEMTRMTTLLLVTVSSFFTLLVIDAILAFTVFGTEDLSLTTTTTTSPSPTEPKPKPGTIMIVTFDNGTTKAIRSDSTNVKAVNGGYLIVDPSVKASQPIQSKAVSKTVVNQLVGMFVDVRIDDAPTTSKGCTKGWGYYVEDPSPICEPLDVIGEEPPKDVAFCAALGCPYNPPNLSDPPSAGPDPSTNDENLVTTPVIPTDLAVELAAQEPEPQPDPEPNPGDGGDSDGGTDEGNTSEEGVPEEE